MEGDRKNIRRSKFIFEERQALDKSKNLQFNRTCILYRYA